MIHPLNFLSWYRILAELVILYTYIIIITYYILLLLLLLIPADLLMITQGPVGTMGCP